MESCIFTAVKPGTGQIPYSTAIKHPSVFMTAGQKQKNGWALQFRSVIVFGRIEWIEDREQIYDIARKLSHKFTNDEAYIEREIEQSGPGTCMFALVPEYMTGKLVTEQ